VCHRRPGLAADSRGAVTGGCGGAWRPVATAARAQAGTDRDRRGAQCLPRRAAQPACRGGHRVRHTDRGRRPQVRALPARVDAAAAEDRPERPLTGRQPRAHAAELARGRGFHAGRVLVRPAEPDRALGHLPPGRGPDRGKDLAPAGPAPLRRADHRGGRCRRARDLGGRPPITRARSAGRPPSEGPP
jgi:hypothetical protein